ncbi:hypothetical protein LPB86_07995 [Pedobacter sp. MC2016-14]|uniref:glycosyl hydrolase family 18 protein n=1 Tax=Pedobacter sp. MC2016-14 TaxID=2897327 RepID=UPI001E3C78BE|nr:glycosyl hydrolase family 18 protein [Pedobacter sp. MC2016-14]MCD0488167.1 hypothetical protein [Pedobacter sp. MC2016-14]
MMSNRIPATSLLKVFLISVLLSGCGKSDAVATEPEVTAAEKKKLKVIGYLYANDLITALPKIEFTKITHVNVSFINPDAAGTFAFVPGLQELVKKAHENNVKVISALAGGDAPGHLKELIKPQSRKILVDGLLQLAQAYNLDGIDVDLEGDFVNENFEGFVTELSAGLKKDGKVMTIAVATWNSAAYTDKALALFDWINIMSYDKTGPWKKDEPGPHAPYEYAESDFAHWNVNRHIPADKLVIGLPFYGYGFGANIQESINFSELVTSYPGSEKEDFWVVTGKGTFFYNGLPTIRKKVAFALKKKMGGVMIWHLLGDAAGDNSLLNAINSSL